MEDFLEVTEEEMVVLIKESLYGKSVTYSFGPGWSAIDKRLPENKWAVDRIMEIRNPVAI